MADEKNKGGKGNGKGKAPYDVGYKKPPAEHQFQPGRSGNPKGRPKGSTSIFCLLRPPMKEIMEESVTGMINGQPTTLKMAQALVRKAFTDAMANSPKLLEALLKLDLQATAIEAKKQSQSTADKQKHSTPAVAHQIKIVFDEPPAQPGAMENAVTNKQKRAEADSTPQ